MKKSKSTQFHANQPISQNQLKQNLDSFNLLCRKMLDEVEDYAILFLDRSGNVLNWNKGAQAIKGYQESDIVGQHFSLFYPPDDRNAGLPDVLLNEAVKNNRATHEGWRLKKDGTRFWGSVVITALRDDNGEVIGFSKLTRDLTAKRSADEALQKQTAELAHRNEELRKSEERYHRMIAEVEDYAIILLGLDGTVMNWNRGAEKIKGYTAQEAIGQNFSIFYRQEDLQSGLPQRLIETATRENKASHEGWRIRRDGSLFWASVVITALHDHEGNVFGFSKVTRDLTERKLAEERQQLFSEELMAKSELLRLSEQQYHRMIAEVEEYSIILLGLEGTIMNWNKGAEKIKGYKETEALGQNFAIFYTPEDRRDNLPDRLLAEAREQGKAIHEGWRIRKDGTRFWGSTVITALHSEENKVIGFSKVTKDLSERKAYEDRISRQNKQLEEYAYVASHDLQEPLRKIQIFSELLQENLDNRELALKNLSKITASAARMGSLIRDVLAYAQVGDSKELFRDVDLNVILANIENDFELTLREKNAKIIYKDLPVIYALPIQIQQLFSNLISNSLKFNDSEPVVEIKYEGKNTAAPGFHRISLTDNGIGMSPEFAGKAFHMFSRMDKNLPGTGIGLALCKKIVETHEGNLTVEPRNEGGSRFSIDLPERLIVN